MHLPDGLSVLAQGSTEAIDDIRRVLDRRGIRSERMAPPGGCGSG